MKLLMLFFLIFVSGLSAMGNHDSLKRAVFMERGDREALLYVPESYTADNPVPLLVMLHGAGQSIRDVREITGFDFRAEQHGFLVLYPQGELRRWDLLGERDVLFIEELIQEVSESYAVDTSRIWLAGGSNGGYMVYRMAASHYSFFQGFGVVAGLPYESVYSKLENPFSMAHLHGLKDSVVNYNVSQGGVSGKRILYQFHRVNQTPKEGEMLYNYNSLKGERWQSEKTGGRYDLWLYEEEAHCWPEYPLNATDILCDFFLSLSRDKPYIRVKEPRAGSELRAGESVAIVADVNNRDVVNRVDFYLNNELLDSDSTFPYEIQSSLSAGYHTLQARLVTEGGDEVLSANPSGVLVLPAKENIAPGKKGWSSSEENPELGAEKAFDGSIQSRWASQEGSDDEYIALDLQEKRVISGVTLIWEAAWAVSYAVEVSDDRTHWQAVFTEGNSPGGLEHIELEGVSARYIRIRCVTRGTQWGYSLREFMVH